MAGIKEIRTRIDSVQQTLKITNAMYLISSSKMRKARQQFNVVRPFFQKVTETISDILHHSPTMDHIYFDKRPNVPEHTVGYVVITGDKGLAGAYNHNVLRLTEERIAAASRPMLFLIGQVGRSYFAQRGVAADGEFLYTAQDPTYSRAEEICDTLIDLFRQGTLDEVYVVYTDMITPMRLETKVQQLLPLDPDTFAWQPRPGEEGVSRQKITYVPDECQVLDHLVPDYVKGVLYGALVESFCSEQNARMMAMDSASTNAREMLKSLSLWYNRVRQAAITQEITEIVGGTQQQEQEVPQAPRRTLTRTVRFLADGSREEQGRNGQCN